MHLSRCLAEGTMQSWTGRVFYSTAQSALCNRIAAAVPGDRIYSAALHFPIFFAPVRHPSPDLTGHAPTYLALVCCHEGGHYPRSLPALLLPDTWQLPAFQDVDQQPPFLCSPAAVCVHFTFLFQSRLREEDVYINRTPARSHGTFVSVR